MKLPNRASENEVQIYTFYKVDDSSLDDSVSFIWAWIFFIENVIVGFQEFLASFNGLEVLDWNYLLDQLGHQTISVRSPLNFMALSEPLTCFQELNQNTVIV